MSKVALIGYSGHAFVVADTLLRMGNEVIGYYEKMQTVRNPYHIPYLGCEDEPDHLRLLKNGESLFFVAIGNNVLRKEVTFFLLSENLTTLIATHPLCITSDKAKIKSGTFVGPGAKINSLAEIGTGVILNTGCIIEHECIIGDFAHIAPGAVLAGNVSVGECSLIGAGAIIKQGITVGHSSVVGAGAVVVKNVPDNQVWMGNPAKPFKNE